MQLVAPAGREAAGRAAFGMPLTQRKAAGKRAVQRSASQRPAARDTLPKLTPQELELYGPRPHATAVGPANIFTVYGAGAYLIDKQQLVSLKPLATEADREARNRQKLVINAGKPTPGEPAAGACFHADFGFTPKDSDVHELQWRDPKPLTFTMGDAVFCSDADALARYTGGHALADERNSAGLFCIFFLNGGEATPATKLESHETHARQRARILHNLRKMFLVFPEIVEPRLGPNGWPCLPRETTETVMKPMLGCFATIYSDKRAGAPGARGGSICGYHDQCRLHILPARHLDKIRELIAHFELAKDLPPVWDNLEDGQVRLEPHRERHVAELKARCGTLTPDDDAWHVLRSGLPLAKPWVQWCNLAHPDGATRACGEPVLVPLVRGGAEERNGVPWLYLEKGDDSAHARVVRDALVRLSGRTPKRRPTEAEVAWSAVALLKRELVEADAQLAEAHAQLAFVRDGPKRPLGAVISPSRRKAKQGRGARACSAPPPPPPPCGGTFGRS